MKKYILLAFLLTSFLPDLKAGFSEPDTADNQILYNGKIWRNLYSKVRGHAFLFSDKFESGSVKIAGRTFTNVDVRYDIYKDELIAVTGNGFLIQMNKEMVEAFSIPHDGIIYEFIRTGSDTLRNPNGYVNVLASGTVSLLVKYRKKIVYLAVDNKYDQFEQLHRMYLMKDGAPYPVNSRRNLLALLDDRKQELKTFIRKENLKTVRKNPNSFRAVVEYYNMLSQK
ncbi:MAG: hypothetical protein MUE74_10190 [Bacteroidales bacterium]|nr:hypothetical protein [Bacteroidales bacterium]